MCSRHEQHAGHLPEEVVDRLTGLGPQREHLLRVPVEQLAGRVGTVSRLKRSSRVPSSSSERERLVMDATHDRGRGRGIGQTEDGSPRVGFGRRQPGDEARVRPLPQGPGPHRGSAGRSGA
jgi:hypothetical protein